MITVFLLLTHWSGFKQRGRGASLDGGKCVFRDFNQFSIFPPKKTGLLWLSSSCTYAKPFLICAWSEYPSSSGFSGRRCVNPAWCDALEEHARQREATDWESRQAASVPGALGGRPVVWQEWAESLHRLKGTRFKKFPFAEVERESTSRVTQGKTLSSKQNTVKVRKVGKVAISLK